MAGLILSSYPIVNMAINSVVLLVAMALAMWINRKRLLSAFSISLSFIIPTFTLIEFVIGCLAPAQIQDNWAVIINLCLIAFEWFFIYTVVKRSNKSAQ